jgi:gliding motility-associated-like protein
MQTLLTWFVFPPALLLCLALLPTALPMPVEICDNGLDDDGDYMIDLNDPDCKCTVIEPVSLIPNPSFEQRNCCPRRHAQLQCAETWQQASVPTTDYLHTCGWYGWEHMPPPLPFPDGNACVGFRNGRFGDEGVMPNWKEYAGACLLAPMRKGVAYRFEFYVGFSDVEFSPPTDIVFYGTTDCNNLPFGYNDDEFGCPTNDSTWRQLASVHVVGNANWVKTEIEIMPEEDIYAIAVGPSCQPKYSDRDIYYFFDNLILDEQRTFEFEILSAGHPCSEDYTLSVPDFDTLSYQWYQDGAALPGETQADLRVKTGSGNYVVRVTSSEGCQVSQVFRLRVPFVTAEATENICPGDAYFFNDRAISEPGVYWDTLKNQFNCDSIVRLDLRVGSDQTDTVRVRIFPGEVFPVGVLNYSEEGHYSVTISSSTGCDSLIWLELEHYKVYIPSAFSPNFDGENDRFVIAGGPDLVRIHDLKIFDRWGGQVFAAADIPPNDRATGWDGRRHGRDVPDGVYLYVAILEMTNGVSRRVSGALTLIR